MKPSDYLKPDAETAAMIERKASHIRERVFNAIANAGLSAGFASEQADKVWEAVKAYMMEE